MSLQQQERKGQKIQEWVLNNCHHYICISPTFIPALLGSLLDPHGYVTVAYLVPQSLGCQAPEAHLCHDLPHLRSVIPIFSYLTDLSPSCPSQAHD